MLYVVVVAAAPVAFLFMCLIIFNCDLLDALTGAENDDDRQSRRP